MLQGALPVYNPFGICFTSASFRCLELPGQASRNERADCTLRYFESLLGCQASSQTRQIQFGGHGKRYTIGQPFEDISGYDNDDMDTRFPISLD